MWFNFQELKLPSLPK